MLNRIESSVVVFIGMSSIMTVTDVWIGIGLYCDLPTIASLSRVSRALNLAMDSVVLWEDLLQRDAPTDLLKLLEEGYKPPGLSKELIALLVKRDDGEATPLCDIDSGATKRLYIALRCFAYPQSALLAAMSKPKSFFDIRLFTQLQLILQAPPMSIKWAPFAKYVTAADVNLKPLRELNTEASVAVARMSAQQRQDLWRQRFRPSLKELDDLATRPLDPLCLFVAVHTSLKHLAITSGATALLSLYALLPSFGIYLNDVSQRWFPRYHAWINSSC